MHEVIQRLDYKIKEIFGEIILNAIIMIKICEKDYKYRSFMILKLKNMN